MDEADRILIDTLISIGLEIESEGITLEDFSPDILIAATSLCLESIFESLNESQNFPKSCPVNMAARFKVGQVLSEALKSIGYRESIGYQSFLYPNVRDSRSIISFLIENLPKDTGIAVQDGVNESTKLNNIIKQALSDSWSAPWLPYYCYGKQGSVTKIWHHCLLIGSDSSLQSQTNDAGELFASVYNYEHRTRLAEKIDISRVKRQLRALEKVTEEEGPLKAVPSIKKRTRFITKEREKEKEVKIEDEENVIKEAEERLKGVETVYEECVSRYDSVIDRLKSIKDMYGLLEIKKDDLAKEIETQRKENVIKEKTGIVVQHGQESIEKLEAAIEKRERQIMTIERQWRSHKEEIIEKISTSESVQREKYSKTRDMERDLSRVRATMDLFRHDYQEKDESIKQLSERVKQVLATGNKQQRNDFTKRILELTENKKKQNSEIRKILADIFVLQKEINSLRGKLDRSFVETNDCIFANAKKDEASKKMYKVVITIHENCQNLVSVIEEKGRLLRDIRDLEMNLESENRENVERNLSKISADYHEAKNNVEKLKKKIKQHNQAINV